MDAGKIGFLAAADLSYLKPEEQKALYGLLQGGLAAPHGSQAEQMKGYSREGRLTETVMKLLLSREAVRYKVEFKVKELKEYFPEGYSAEQMSEVIVGLLKRWSGEGGEKC